MKMAPAPGLEPGTKWLTATYSTIELCRSKNTFQIRVRTATTGISKKMAPALGFEPRTKWLTATYSTAELCRSVVMVLNISLLLVFSSLFLPFLQKFLHFMSPAPLLPITGQQTKQPRHTFFQQQISRRHQ